jgi:hypothetical protein
MKIRKITTLLLSIFFVLAFFAEGATADICFCGKSCTHSFQNKTDLKIRSIFHNFHKRCSGKICKSCNLESDMSLKGAIFIKNTPKTKPFAKFITLNFLYLPSINQSATNSYLLYVNNATQPLSLYLKNLSIRC